MVRKISFLKGAFTPLVVPFTSGEVDYGLYARLIEWQINQGADGLLVNATSGEPTTLTLEEKARLIEVAVETAAGRKPVAAGIPAESHAEAVMLLARAEKAGADARRFGHTLLRAAAAARSYRVFRRSCLAHDVAFPHLPHSRTRGGVGYRGNFRSDRRALPKFRRVEEHRRQSGAGVAADEPPRSGFSHFWRTGEHRLRHVRARRAAAR